MDVNRYLNRPWINGTQDCWTLVRDFYLNEFGIELPQIIVDAKNPLAVRRAFSDPDNLKHWVPIDKPEHGCLVFFASKARPSHVAVYLDEQGGKYLHSFVGAGSVCESVFDADVSGFHSPRYYRHISLG